jgi:hypothetical protein
VASVLLESSGDCSESFDVVEVDLDEIPLSVGLAVQSRLLAPSWMSADDRLHSALPYSSNDVVRVVSSVTDECAPLCVFLDNERGYRGFMLLARREFDVERTPLGVDERVEFRGEATSRVPQCIDFDPPFPPDASWWARMTEASIMHPSASTSNCSALRSVAHVPRWDHSLNRL